MSWKNILKNKDYLEGMTPEEIKTLANKRRWNLRLLFAVEKHGKGSEEVMEIWNKYMKTNPSQEEQEEYIAYYHSIKEKEKPKTQREIEIEQFKQRQRQAIEDLERKSCECKGETSNIESVEKVAGAVTTGAAAHSHLFKPRYGKKKKRCKKCRK